MAIKTDELQQNAKPVLTDTLLMADSAGGTAQLSLAQAAAFFGTELVKAGNPVGAALSNKADVLKATRDLYVSNSGSDTTGDGTAAKPFASIQRAINTLPKNLNGHKNTIHVAAGTYAGFRIEGFYGGSYSNHSGIKVSGDENGGAVISGAAEIYGCEVHIEIEYLKITGMQNGFNISILCCGGGVDLKGCKCTGTTAVGGIWVQKTMAKIYYCEISDKTASAVSIDGSVVFASYINGSGNTVCFKVGESSSGAAGLLIGDLHNITGATKYLRERGGVVFADGALV